MIVSIRGILQARGVDFLTIDVGGVGIQVFVPTSTLSTVGNLGDDVKLHTYLHFKEDALALYGFSFEEELRICRMLLNVAGMGPRTSLNALGVASPSTIVAAPQVRRQYVVQRGDNLWRISEAPAREHNQNIFQVMLVTKDLNQHAFIKDNINLLLSGATLDLPTLHDIEHGSVSETVLVSEIKKQNAAWAMHKDKSSQVALEVPE